MTVEVGVEIDDRCLNLTPQEVQQKFFPDGHLIDVNPTQEGLTLSLP